MTGSDNSLDRPGGAHDAVPPVVRATPSWLAGTLTRPLMDVAPPLRSLVGARVDEDGPRARADRPAAARQRAITRPATIPAVGDITNGNPFGRAKVDLIDAWVLLDQSRSEFGDHGDQGARFSVAEALLAGIEASGPGARYAIVHWGSSTPSELMFDPAPITGSASTRRERVQARSPLGATRIAAPLRALQDRAGQADRLERVYVITDGQAPVDHELREALAALPAGAVNLVLCDPQRRCSIRREQALRAAGFASVTRLQLTDSSVLQTQLRELLADSIGLTAAERERPPKPTDSRPQRLRRQLGSLHTPSSRRWLALPIAAVLAIAAVALSQHHSPTPPQHANPPSATSGQVGLSARGSSSVWSATHARRAHLSGVGMPQTLPGNTLVKPLRIELVLEGLRARVEQRELRALGSWLATHTNPATRVTVINPRAHTRTAPLTATQLLGMPVPHRIKDLASTETRAWSAGVGRRLLVTYGVAVTVTIGPHPATLHLIGGPRTTAPDQFALAPGQARTMSVDVRRARMLAATVARAVIAMTHMQAAR